ncbi:Zinc resistance conferring protein [Leucoagaricus gongylophorus]
MHIAENIRRTLHHLGIHSCTIQPEYAPSNTPIDSSGSTEVPCLVLCPPDQACDPTQNACCPPLTTDA